MKKCNYVRKDGGLQYCTKNQGLGYCMKQDINCSYSDSTLIKQTTTKNEDDTYTYREFSACRFKIVYDKEGNCGIESKL